MSILNKAALARRASTGRRAADRLVVCASHSPGKDRDTQCLHGTKFRAALADAAQRCTSFDPDVVVLFGGDHRRAFNHVVPTFAVVLSATIIAEGPYPPGTLDVASEVALGTSEYLLRANFDVAVCRDIALDHAFGQPLRDLLGDLAAKPVIPIAINCATAPLPTAARVLDFGAAVAEFLDQQQLRALVIGTGGLSHSPPSLDVDAYQLTDDERRRLITEGMPAAREKIRPDWDEEVLAAFARWDTSALTHLVDVARMRGGSGANEVRTWLAAAAAGGGTPLRKLVYQPVPEWITGMAVAMSA
ncbi:3-carboxyethylcatechol 2,3-dioxygenase [Mycobacterium paraseoulense]|uniref:3-carboxyethylcatechol 2,3-dioxygenase n=1 Tax=Mycobacterium TaxID=1763 RepID=UPI0009F5F3A8|nr:3-carboxyethylcatechol 2,3-dioxygenase [Mycobacterium paraseoulense]MCV7393879.1 3-carboxyethylcatechol 2,3-dioxygenase [Mycobacterium paraseoulense]BBZ70496.1 2,3-dihydroxyphenylpropionate/2,3-dihydroxicinnam ic acid 1,2-dioxygenase [Mycobacterium paraseoulense]